MRFENTAPIRRQRPHAYDCHGMNSLPHFSKITHFLLLPPRSGRLPPHVCTVAKSQNGKKTTVAVALAAAYSCIH